MCVCVCFGCTVFTSTASESALLEQHLPLCAEVWSCSGRKPAPRPRKAEERPQHKAKMPTHHGQSSGRPAANQPCQQGAGCNRQGPNLGSQYVQADIRQPWGICLLPRVFACHVQVAASRVLTAINAPMTTRHPWASV